MTKTKSLIFYTILALVAIVTGVAIGSIYLNTLPKGTSGFGLTEAMFRDDDKTIEALYKEAINGGKTSFSAVELYQIGEYKLKNGGASYVKVLSGDVSAGVGFIKVPQQMKSIKISTSDGVYYLKMSKAESSMAPSMAVKQKYEYDNPNMVYLNETRDSNDIDGDTSEDFKLVIGEDTARNITVDEYKLIFNTSPATPLTYIISSKTTAEGNFDQNVTLNSSGKYVFKIKMTGEYATNAATYYSYEIAHFSNKEIVLPPSDVTNEAEMQKYYNKVSSALPKWQSVEIEGVMDENFNLVSLKYKEVYTVKQMGLNATVTDNFTDVFYYDQKTIDESLALL